MTSKCSTVDKRRKQTWESFTGHHIQKFYGLRIRWNPNTCQISESFKTVRHFYSVDDGDEEVIEQKNTHHRENQEPLVLGPWKLSLADRCLS